MRYNCQISDDIYQFLRDYAIDDLILKAMCNTKPFTHETEMRFMAEQIRIYLHCQSHKRLSRQAETDYMIMTVIPEKVYSDHCMG
jgi:hypothetical protein